MGVFRVIQAGRILAWSVLLLTVSVAGVTVHGQPNQNYSIRWNTETSFDQIPFGNLVQYVLTSVAFAKEHEVFTPNELSTIYNAEMTNPRLDRTYGLFEEACAWYLQIIQTSDELDYEYMGNIASLADQYEAEDKNAPYMAAYEKLSFESKRFVLNRIESLRGTRVMSSSIADYRRLFVDYPETAISVFDRLCARLPEMLEQLENRPELKTFENVQVVPLQSDAIQD